MHTLTKSLSYITTTLKMKKSGSASISSSGSISATLNVNADLDFHHIILSGVFEATSGGKSTGGMFGHVV